MREISVAEQRYQAVLAVISDGLSISQVATKVGVSRQTQLPASGGPDRTTSATSQAAGNNTMQAANNRQRPTRRSDR